MSFIKIWIHAVWGTKNREPILTRDQRMLLFSHLKQYALEKELYVDCINGYTEHVHCLFELNAEISLAKTMQLLKGESSHWANTQGLFKTRLQWADEYFAGSVSESMLEKAREYIRNQEAHHKKRTFAEEYNLFLQKYGLRNDKLRHP